MKKLLFLTVPLMMVGVVALTANKGASADFADYEIDKPAFNVDKQIGFKKQYGVASMFGEDNYDYGDIPDSGSISGKYSQFEDIANVTSYLGYGYNVIRSRYINKYDVLKTNPIFDMNQLRNTNLLLDRENSFDCRTYRESTMSEFSEDYNASLKVDGSYGPFFSGGLEADYQGSSTAKTYYYFYKGAINIKTFSLTMSVANSDLRNMLASDFQTALYNTAPAQLFDKYGTHFLKDITMGGRLELNVKYSSESNRVTENAQAAVNARLNYMNYCLGIEANAGYANTLEDEHIEESQNIFYVGGPQLPMTGAESVRTYLPQWVQSFNTDLSKSSLVDVPNYQALVPLWELVNPNNQTRRNELINYFISAVQGSNNTLYQRFVKVDLCNLNITKNGKGSIAGNNSPYKAGSSVTLTATPSTGYEFDGWYKGNTRVSTSRTYSFTIQSNTSLTVKFKNMMTMTGSGTINRPFIITNSTELSQIRYAMSAYYKLGNDIDFENKLFNPIPGTFNGELNGNGKTLKRLKIDKLYSSGSSTGYLGLFEKLGSSGHVKDLNINESTLTARQSSSNNSLVYCGFVCGMNNGGHIENVDYFKSSVGAENKISIVGGIAGYSTGRIENCDLLGCTVFGSDLVGGIVGSSDRDSSLNRDSIVSNCSFDAETFFGAFAVTSGQIKLVVKNVSNSFAAGGIAGYCYRATVSDCSVRFTNFTVEGTLGTRQYPAMGYVVGYLSAGSLNYKPADFRNLSKTNINSSNSRYYFAVSNGYVGRTDNNSTIREN